MKNSVLVSLLLVTISSFSSPSEDEEQEDLGGDFAEDQHNWPPCGGGDNIKSCTCKDGLTVVSHPRKCGRVNRPAVSCCCNDTSVWILPRGPCADGSYDITSWQWRWTATATCSDRSTFTSDGNLYISFI